MTRTAFYEDTVRLEGDIKLFSHTLCHQKNKLASVVAHYQSRNEVQQVHIDLVKNTVLNLAILASVTFLLS